MKCFTTYFRPLYSNNIAKYFALWKRHTSELQSYEIRTLEIKKDILIDELTQTVQINETLKD